MLSDGPATAKTGPSEAEEITLGSRPLQEQGP